MPYSAVIQEIPSLSYDNLIDLLSLVTEAIKTRKAEVKKADLKKAQEAFCALREEAQSYGEMSLDEINAEIVAVRKEQSVVNA